jgi:hypothetical protein
MAHMEQVSDHTATISINAVLILEKFICRDDLESIQLQPARWPGDEFQGADHAETRFLLRIYLDDIRRCAWLRGSRTPGFPDKCCA